MRGGSQSMVKLQDKFKELFKELTGGEINKKNLPVNQKNLPGILMEIKEDDYAKIKPILFQMYGKVHWVEKAFKDAERKKKELGKDLVAGAEGSEPKGGDWQGEWSDTMELPGLMALATSSGINLEVLHNQLERASRRLPLTVGAIVKTPSGMGQFVGKGRMDRAGNLQVKIGDHFFSFDQITAPTPEEMQSYPLTTHTDIIEELKKTPSEVERYSGKMQEDPNLALSIAKLAEEKAVNHYTADAAILFRNSLPFLESSVESEYLEKVAEQTFQLAAMKETEEDRRADAYSGWNLQVPLPDRARAMGIDDAAIAAAEGAEDPKAALTSLIIARFEALYQALEGKSDAERAAKGPDVQEPLKKTRVADTSTTQADFLTDIKAVDDEADRLREGEPVEYLSKTHGRWVSAVVERVHSDGSISLDVKPRADPRWVRPSSWLRQRLGIEASDIASDVGTVGSSEGEAEGKVEPPYANRRATDREARESVFAQKKDQEEPPVTEPAAQGYRSAPVSKPPIDQMTDAELRAELRGHSAPTEGSTEELRNRLTDIVFFGIDFDPDGQRVETSPPSAAAVRKRNGNEVVK